MHATNKKGSGMTRRFYRPAEQAVQFKPAAIQSSVGVPAQSVQRPVAPPVYRPQQAPGVLRKKTPSARGPQLGQATGQPIAPPVYRPQPLPRVLQTKSSSVQKRPAGQGLRRPVAPPV